MRKLIALGAVLASLGNPVSAAEESAILDNFVLLESLMDGVGPTPEAIVQEVNDMGYDAKTAVVTYFNEPTPGNYRYAFCANRMDGIGIGYYTNAFYPAIIIHHAFSRGKVDPALAGNQYVALCEGLLQDDFMYQ